MVGRVFRYSLGILTLMAVTAGTAAAQTCITIQDAYDTLTREERAAAVLLVKRQFEQAGHRVADADCQGTYTLSHIRLGRTIVVSLSGPLGAREGRALGLDDLPAVYSQMVRSLTTGAPMGTMAVLDRGNVSEAQDLPPRRVQPEGFWHARVGQSNLFGPTASHGASFGFGYRAEFDKLGFDVSFFNFMMSDRSRYLGGSGGSTMSLVKLEGLYFLSPKANRSAYLGGGLSYGHTDLWVPDDGGFYGTSGRGSGLQAELTAGYEIARVTSARFFVQADVTLPLYEVTFEHYAFTPPVVGQYTPPTVTVDHHYAPSLTLSVGLGWQRGRR